MGKTEKVQEFEGFEVYKYTPDIFNLFGPYYPEKITIRRIIRFLMAFPDGYEIFSLVEKDETLGYCVIQSGKCPRFDYSTENDIIVGPYMIMPKHQGKGLAGKLIAHILKMKCGSYRNAFAYIKRDNLASIRTCEKIGFRFFGNVEVTKVKADVKLSEKDATKHVLYRIEGGKRQL